jgi:UDP-glucose 4-epimerase
MKTVLLTGSQGFIGSYICEELLSNGYEVIGVDNFSKYGVVKRLHDRHPNFHLIARDVQHLDVMESCINVDYIIAGAAIIGGIQLFHELPYDLLATNDRIIASTFDYAIKYKPKRVVVISSSMVFESATEFPSKEEDVLKIPPPLSSYGFQKLATEYYARAAYDQYGVEYVICRPFNCVGVGEGESKIGSGRTIGNVKMQMSHVIPDLIHRALNLKSTDTFPILGLGNQSRCYTHGSDIARGIRLAMELPQAKNEDFNISNPNQHSVIQIATEIWRKIHGCDPIFTHEDPYKYDVQFRLPDVTKAKDILGFEAIIPVDQSINVVIQYMRDIK